MSRAQTATLAIAFTAAAASAAFFGGCVAGTSCDVGVTAVAVSTPHNVSINSGIWVLQDRAEPVLFDADCDWTVRGTASYRIIP